LRSSATSPSESLSLILPANDAQTAAYLLAIESLLKKSIEEQYSEDVRFLLRKAEQLGD